jgi:hypothetical protein
MSYDLLFGPRNASEKRELGPIENWFRSRPGWTVSPAHQAYVETPGGDFLLLVDLYGPEIDLYGDADVPEDQKLDRHVPVFVPLGWGDAFNDQVWELFAQTFSQLCEDFEMYVLDPQSATTSFVPFDASQIREEFKFHAKGVMEAFPEFYGPSGGTTH